MKIVAYVGDLNDERFKWEGGNWNGNVPKRQSPEIWFSHDVQRIMLKRIEEGKLVGKQTDWGAYVAKATRKDIEDIINTIETDMKDIIKNFKNNPFDDFREFLNLLNEDQEYALVTAEI